MLIKEYAPHIDLGMLALAMMYYWGLFAIPEIMMMAKFPKMLQFTSQDEPSPEREYYQTEHVKKTQT